jgi:hypothetical protein
MADNVQITAGSGTTIAADSCTVNGVAGVLVQDVKVGFGTNDVWTYVTSTVGLPVAVVGPVAVNATQAGDSIQIGGTAYPVLRAFANPSASGDNTIVAAVAGKKVRVLAYSIGPVAGAVNVTLKSATAGAISSTKYLPAAGSGMGRGLAPFGHCETVAGEALVLNLSAAVAVGVDLLYILD